MGALEHLAAIYPSIERVGRVRVDGRDMLHELSYRAYAECIAALWRQLNRDICPLPSDPAGANRRGEHGL